MAQLKGIIAYIHNKYPNSQEELSVDRLIKLIYLSDWKCAIAHGQQMTKVVWEIRESQPYMDKRSVEKLVEVLAKIRVGSLLPINTKLSAFEEEIVDFVIESTVSKQEEELNRLVYSTYPSIAKNNADVPIDLSRLAEEYNQEVRPQLQLKLL